MQSKVTYKYVTAVGIFYYLFISLANKKNVAMYNKEFKIAP